MRVYDIYAYELLSAPNKNRCLKRLSDNGSEVTDKKKSQELIDIENLASQIATSQGFLLVSARFTTQGRRRTLEVTIHRPHGRVSLDDCESMSRLLDAKLEETTKPSGAPLITDSYDLSVMSPGIDRQLKSDEELEIFKGEKVKVLLKKPHDLLGDCFIAVLDSHATDSLHLTSPLPFKQPSHGRKGKKESKNKLSPELPDSIKVSRDALLSVKLHPQIPEESKDHDNEHEFLDRAPDANNN